MIGPNLKNKPKFSMKTGDQSKIPIISTADSQQSRPATIPTPATLTTPATICTTATIRTPMHTTIPKPIPLFAQVYFLTLFTVQPLYDFPSL